MAGFGRVLEVLRDYRNELEQQTHEEVSAAFSAVPGAFSAFAAQGGLSAFATPLSNVHATGVGVRVRDGEVVPGEFVLKLYVYEKIGMDAAPDLSQSFADVEVDVEQLPVQHALAGVPPQQQRQRPIVGGVSIAPLNQPYVGTLGCFLRRVDAGREQLFALSNNHVLADVNSLPIGTSIVQPGPEVGPASPGDVFAALSAFSPIQFPTGASPVPIVNRLDAAVAIVADAALIRTGEIFGIGKYTPQLLAAVPGMKVIKCGRTTGVTRGTITATHVNGVKINYGSRTAPRIATFNDTIQIVGQGGQPFSLPGDSGSVVLEEESGKPVALLFAGDGRTTTTCDFGAVCQQFQAFPV